MEVNSGDCTHNRGKPPVREIGKTLPEEVMSELRRGVLLRDKG